MCRRALSPSQVRSNKKSQSKTCTLPPLIGQKGGLLPRSLLTVELPPQQATMAPQATKKDEARWFSVTQVDTPSQSENCLTHSSVFVPISVLISASPERRHRGMHFCASPEG